MGKVFITILGLLGVLLCSPFSWSQTTSEALASSNSESLKAVKPNFTSQKTWSISTGFEGLKEGRDDGFSSVLRVSSDMNLQFSPWLKIQLRPYASYYSSRVQNRFKDDSYESRLGLSYAHLTLEPISGLDLKAGAISQKHIANKQLISSFRSFPGALVEYENLSLKNVAMGVRAQYVIPTSSSLNTDRQSQEALPTFQTESLFLNYTQTSWKLESQAGLFAWSNIPSKVAYESSQAGNTPANSDSEAESYLRYGYKGWFGSLKGNYTFESGLNLGLGMMRFSNTDAPTALADSQRVFGSAEYSFEKLGLAFELGSFFSEADASIAKYTSSGFGNTNRKGEYIEGKFDIKPYQFYVVSKYARANELNQISYQDDLESFSVMVESYEFQF